MLNRRFRQNLMDYISYYIAMEVRALDYKKILQTVATEYKTTPAEVEKEINEAIKAAGLNITPQLFIAICVAKVKKDYKS